jgi:transcriptional regulator with XRE-family HTH domain
MDMDIFGERLRLLREKRGLTREQLARATGFTEMSIGRWEKAETVPDIKTLNEFVKFFGCSAGYLIGTEN